MPESIVVDWAFATAIGAAGSEMDRFLQTCESFRRADARDSGREQAVSSAQPLGRWAKTYLAPDLCAIIRGRATSPEASGAARVLLDLINGEEEVLRDELRTALRDAIGGSDALEIFGSLECAAKRWLEVEDPADFGSRTDYSEIEFFIAPAVMLAIAKVLASEDAAKYGGVLKGDLSSVQRFVDLCSAALAGRYGRHCFLAAMDLGLAAPAFVAEDAIAEAFAAIPRERLADAPDFMARLVRVEFPRTGREETASLSMEYLTQELVTLEVYRARFGNNTSRRASVTLALWRNAVCTLMFDIDVAVAADVLSAVWLPRILTSPARNTVSVPLHAIPPGLAGLLHLSFAPLRDGRSDLTLRTDVTAGLSGATAVLSPWLPLRTWSNQTQAERLRFLCALALDIRLLESRAFTVGNAGFALHLLSSIALLRGYRNFSGPTAAPRQANDVTDGGNLGWMAKRLVISGSEAVDGTGHLSVDAFLDLLEDAAKSASAIPHLDVAEVDTKNAEPGLRRQLATAALRLVEDAVAGSSQIRGEGWLSVARRVAKLHASCTLEGEIISDDVTLRGLVTRYLVGDPFDQSWSDGTIVADLNNASNAEGISHRRLLLASDVPTRDWMTSDTPRAMPLLFDALLAQAMQRVTAVSTDTDIDPLIVATWRKDLHNLIRRVTDPRHFDRFSRLKLIEMLAKGVFDDLEDLRFAAVTTSIAFGGPVHVRKLTLAVAGAEISSEAQANTRLAVFAGLTRYLTDVDLRGDPSTSAKQRLLQQLKAACLFAAKPDQADIAIYISGQAREWRAKEFAGAAPQSVVSIPIEAHGVARYRADIPRDYGEWLAVATAEMVLLDVTTGNGGMLHAPRIVEDVANSFAPTARDAGRSRPHLGVVEHTYPHPHGGHELEVRISGQNVVKIRDPASRPSNFGDLVVIDSVSTGPAPVPRAVGRRRILPLGIVSPRRYRTTITLVPASDERPPALQVAAPEATPLDWIDRTFNLAALHQMDLAPYECWLVADSTEHVSKRTYRPAELDFSDLMIDFSTEIARGETITLALHEIVFGSDNDIVLDLILEARPLQLYRVGVEVSILPETLADIESCLRQLRNEECDPRGLLLSFTIQPTALGPQLSLAPNVTARQTKPVYEELQQPFDRRNLHWRDLFSAKNPAERPAGTRRQASSLLWATRLNRYFFKAEPPISPGMGRWPLIRVTLEEPSQLEVANIEPAIQTWEPYSAKISGSAVETKSLALPARQADKTKLIQWLETLNAPSIVPLKRPAKTVRREGRVVGYTAENLEILLNAETVSMKLPCRPDANWPNGREATIIHFQWHAIRTDPIVRREDVPAPAIDGGRARGYLSTIPVGSKGGGARCGIVWWCPGQAAALEANIWIDNLFDIQRGEGAIAQGSRLEIVLTESGPRAKLLEPHAVADALWQRAADMAPDAAPAGEYIGSTRIGGSTADVYEVAPGSFSVQPTPGRNISARESVRRLFGLKDDYVVTLDHVDHYTPGRSFNNMPTRRCALIGPNNSISAGVTEAGVVRGTTRTVRLTGVHLDISANPGGRGFLLQRKFQLFREQQRYASNQQRSDEHLPTDDEAEAPDDSAKIDGPVIGRYFASPDRVVFTGKLRRSFPGGLPVDPARIQRAPLLHEPFASNEATAILVRADPPLASFTDVLPSALHRLQEKLADSRDETTAQSYQLDPARLRLYFVGRVRLPAAESDVDEWFYEFEWGYGAWIRLRASEVRYNEDPIERTELLLFFGDRISAAEVVDGGQGSLTLVIKAVVPSPAHELYRSSKIHRLVNLLEITSNNGEPQIASIQGWLRRFTPRATTPRAQLDDAGQAVLRQRLVSNPSARILGRLDTELFKESWGSKFVFTHTRMDLDGSCTNGLRDGDRTFVLAGRILDELNNDSALQVRHPGLHPDDVDVSFMENARRPQRILRRSFSFREQTLGDVLAATGPGAFMGYSLLIRLSRQGHSLNDGTLPRRSELISKQLQLGYEVLAIYGGQSEHNGRDQHDEPKLLFELRPGLVVGLDPDEVEGAPKLYRGDIVRMTLENDKLHANLAIASDGRFALPGRPAVLLPKENLRAIRSRPPYADNRAHFGATNSFSVGGLPDLTASIRVRQRSGRVSIPSEAILRAFMAQPHPKVGELIALISFGERRGVDFTPGLNAPIQVGHVQIGNPDAEVETRRSTLSVSMVAMNEARDAFQTDWYLLSYRDCAAVDLAQVTRTARWQFHDRSTTTWVPAANGTGVDAIPSVVADITAVTGPVFFEVRDDKTASLRHHPNELAKYASSLTGLPSHPSDRRGADRRHAAAVVAAPRPDGLYIELSPGRIVSVLGEVVRYFRYGVSMSLRDLDWTKFASGDAITITSQRRDSVFTPLELNLEWTHGVRSGIGPKGAVLARDPSAGDPEKGLAVYGHGPFRIELPSQEVEALPELAIVGGPHHLSRFSASALNLQGCTVLAVESGDGGIGVHGLHDVELQPAKNYAWHEDELMVDAVRLDRTGNLTFALEQLLQRIRLAGGALPLTVAYFLDAGGSAHDELRGTAYVSRVGHDFRVPDGKIVRAHVCGVISPANRVQMRLGGLYFAVQAHLLLEGLQADDVSDAVAALAATGRPIWLKSAEGKLQSGCRNETGSTCTVAPVAVVGRDDAFIAVICEGILDGKIRWLSAAEAVGCDLTFEDARAAFGSPQLEKFQVVRLQSGDVSILAHAKVRAEQEILRLGVRTGVVPVRGSTITRPFWEAANGRSDWVGFLARSCETSLLLPAIGPAAVATQLRFQGEVTARQVHTRGVQLLLCPSGDRQLLLDGPAWLLDLKGSPWTQDAVPRYLRSQPEIEAADALVAAFARSSSPEVNLDVLEKAARHYIKADTVSLLLGVAISAALDQVTTNTRAYATRRALLRNLFARSLRSIPHEHLATWRLAPLPEMSVFSKERYSAMATLFQNGRLEEVRNAAESWLGAIAVEMVTPREEALANAVSAMIGVCWNGQGLFAEAKLLGKVIAATRPLQLALRVPTTTLNRATAELMVVGRSLIDDGFDIPLQPPLSFPSSDQ